MTNTSIAKLVQTAFCLLGTIAWPLAAPSQTQVTRNLADVHAAATQLANECGPEHVLVVFDVDNTLLAMNQDLGSDQWFDWQSGLLKDQPQSADLVAADFNGVLEVQGLLFELGSMHPPQRDAASLVRDLQCRKIHCIVMTSRGSDFRPATIRELVANQYDFRRTALPTREHPPGPYPPYDPENITAAGFTSAEQNQFKLDAPRNVTYAQGIYMLAGQHKGAMLLALLRRSDAKISAVVFVDDHQRHVDRVVQAVSQRRIVVKGFRYSAQDDAVARFETSDKRHVARQWNRLRKTLRDLFGEVAGTAE